MGQIVATEEQYSVVLNDDGTYQMYDGDTPINFADALGNNRARSLAVRYGGQTPAREQEIATMSDLPSLDLIPSPEADAKDMLRSHGIVVGPDRFGNWSVPCGSSRIDDWRPGDPITDYVMVRNNGAFDGADIHWDWLRGCWDVGAKDSPDGPLPNIY
jgi:hypothetical protein